MTITNQNVDIYRGDSAIIFIGLTNEAGGPFDAATASDIYYRVAKTAHAINSEALISKDMGNGIAAVEGGINITLESIDTDLLPAVYYHELKVLGSVLGAVVTAMTGSFVVHRSLRIGQQFQAQLHLVGSSNMRAVP